LRIETSRTTEDLGCDLVLLKCDAGVIEGVFREVAEKFA
jgi:hypothetical protein